MKRALIVFALLAGCAHAPPRPPVVWPEAPDTPRIRFVTAFRHTDDLDTGSWSRFRRSVLGGSNDPALHQPMGLAISDDGQRVYVADPGISHVFVADLKSKRVALFAPDEAMGQPFNVALDAEENVYVTDPGGAVLHVFTKDGKPLKTLGAKLFDRPTGLAIDRDRKLIYVSDTSHAKSEVHRVRVLDFDGKLVRDLGQPKRGEADGEWNFPTYVAVDKAGDVFVADSMNFRIQEFDASGKFLRKFGVNGDGPGAFSRIKGLAFDGFGNLYVVDGGHSNVQLFNEEFQVLMFFGGYAKKLEYFDVPSGIAIDPRTNRIYVCNEFVSRINVYELINTRPEDSKPAPAEKQASSTEPERH